MSILKRIIKYKNLFRKYFCKNKLTYNGIPMTYNGRIMYYKLSAKDMTQNDKYNLINPFLISFLKFIEHIIAASIGYYICSFLQTF
jgi:hypothetical protein